MIELQDLLIGQSLQFEYVTGAVRPVQSGEITQWRTMPCSCISHVTGGEWLVEVEDAPSYNIRAGEASCMPAGMRHRLIMVSEGISMARWAHFNILLYGYLDVLSLVDLRTCFVGDVAQRMGVILEELAFLKPEAAWLFGSLNRKALEFELAALIVHESTLKYQSELRLQQLQRVLPALGLIHGDIAANFTREKLAAHVYLSPSRFATIFKEALGLSPIDYIVKLRMQRAQQLLLDTHLLIEQVAAKVGYDDALYFSRLFKVHYGLSPRQYRTEGPHR
jgi:AraC-like DNA-binding protein